MPAQVLKEGFTLTGFRDGKHLVRRWRDHPLAALPEVLRMAVGQVGIVPFDAERLKRPHILRERLRATEPCVEIVDLLDGKHDQYSLRCQVSLVSHGSLLAGVQFDFDSWRSVPGDRKRAALLAE